eukprot:6468151-Amphidinium_carterae.1
MVAPSPSYGLRVASKFWQVVARLPQYWAVGDRSAVRQTKKYAQALQHAQEPESLEYRRRRERLLLLWLAGLDNLEHFPWPHLDGQPGLPDPHYRFRIDQPMSRNAWERKCSHQIQIAANNYSLGNRRCYRRKGQSSTERPPWIHDCFVHNVCVDIMYVDSTVTLLTAWTNRWSCAPGMPTTCRQDEHPLLKGRQRKRSLELMSRIMSIQAEPSTFHRINMGEASSATELVVSNSCKGRKGASPRCRREAHGEAPDSGVMVQKRDGLRSWSEVSLQLNANPSQVRH